MSLQPEKVGSELAQEITIIADIEEEEEEEDENRDTHFKRKCKSLPYRFSPEEKEAYCKALKLTSKDSAN